MLTTPLLASICLELRVYSSVLFLQPPARDDFLCSRHKSSWCFCRSCDAGLQAGAAKCQTLTLFASRRAVENFIQTHVRVASHVRSVWTWRSVAARKQLCLHCFHSWAAGALQTAIADQRQPD